MSLMRCLLHELGGLSTLIDLLHHSEGPVVLIGMYALDCVCDRASNMIESVLKTGALPTLVEQLNSPNRQCAMYATHLLANIARRGPQFKNVVLNAGVVSQIILVARAGQRKPDVTGYCTQLLAIIAAGPVSIKRRLLDERVLEATELALHYTAQYGEAAAVLANVLAHGSLQRSRIQASPVMAELRLLARSCNGSPSEAAVEALAKLGEDLRKVMSWTLLCRYMRDDLEGRSSHNRCYRITQWVLLTSLGLGFMVLLAWLAYASE